MFKLLSKKKSAGKGIWTPEGTKPQDDLSAFAGLKFRNTNGIPAHLARLCYPCMLYLGSRIVI